MIETNNLLRLRAGNEPSMTSDGGEPTQARADAHLLLGETRTPMIMKVIGHWLFGLPIGYALCFVFGWGVTGLWIGLSIGLVIAGTTLTAEWARRTRTLLA